MKYRLYSGLLFCIISLGFSSAHQPELIVNPKDTTFQCDYLILAPEKFKDAALRLAKHRNHYMFDTVTNARVLLLPDLYKAFPQPDSLRYADKIWFGMHWIYTHWKSRIRYIVLFGGDSVLVDDAKKTAWSVGEMPSFIWNIDPPSGELRFCYTDDIYTMLESDMPVYDEKQYVTPLYIGRIPAETADQAEVYLDKLMAFDSAKVFNGWRNRVIVAADDEFVNDSTIDNLGHYQSADLVAAKMDGYFIDKCYLSEFRKNKAQFPGNARTSFVDRLNKGALFAVYFGHGNHDHYTDEWFLQAADDSSFKNKQMPTAMLSFTSYNGLFSKPNAQSMAKRFLFAPGGGALVYIAATELTYATENTAFATTLFPLFRKNQNADIGTVLRLTKQTLPLHAYHLLGDPALRLFRSSAQLTITPTQIDSRTVRLNCLFMSKLEERTKFAYEISVIESVSVDNGAGPVKFVRNRIIKDSSGMFPTMALQFDVSRGYADKQPVHVDLFTWNAWYEEHKDTTLFLEGSSSIEPHQKTCGVVTRLSILTGRSVRQLQIPTVTSGSTLRISLYTLNGRRIISQIVTSADGAGILDVRSLHLPRGVFTIECTDPAGRGIQKKVLF